jgi:hypothetical protein
MQTFIIPLQQKIICLTACEHDKNFFVIVCESKEVYGFDIVQATCLKIGFLTHFEHIADTKIYSYKNYICIVENRGLHGVVLDLQDTDFYKILFREDYHTEHCSFSIGFFTKDEQVFLIHGTARNRLDITCLKDNTLQTNRLIDYETNTNYVDYFHSLLAVSPDEKSFVSNGWVWSPCDAIMLFSVEFFLKTYENSHVFVTFEQTTGYNWDRPLCWVDNQTLAVAYNKGQDSVNEGIFVSEILLIDLIANKIIDRIDFEGFARGKEDNSEVFGNLYFDPKHKFFIALNNQTGLLITDLKGREIYKNSLVTTHLYSPQYQFFYSYKEGELEVVGVGNVSEF